MDPNFLGGMGPGFLNQFPPEAHTLMMLAGYGGSHTKGLGNLSTYTLLFSNTGRCRVLKLKPYLNT